MFCVQCEQTIRTPAGNGCSYAQGMCGKTARNVRSPGPADCGAARLIRLAFKAREYGLVDHYVDSFAPRAFFSTLTNVNFDSPRIVGYAREAIALREALKAQCLNADASARVDNPMAELQLVSDDRASYSVRPPNLLPIKTKRRLARTSSACACCACTV